MDHQKKKGLKLWARHRHIRHKLIGTPERPRLSVYRSLKHIYCQLIDDTYVDKKGVRSGRTLASSSTLTAENRSQITYGGNIKAAKLIGQDIAKQAVQLGISKISFDRGGRRYHGRIKALADGAREGGLSF